MGIDNFSTQSTMIENIVAHLADPANAAEIAAKTVAHRALSTDATRFFDDTVVYNWRTAGSSSNPDRNTEGLETARMDATTIQRFASEVLGKDGASISDLADYLRGNAEGRLNGIVDADLIIAFFREGFGLDVSARTEARTLVFEPDVRADGIRWDNRLNWNTDDLPGSQENDSIDLNGNAVTFAGMTVQVENLSFGDFGKLSAYSGKLTVEGGTSVEDTGASLFVERAGQVWINGYRDADMLDIDVMGGRFANFGQMVGAVDMTVGDNAQAILVTSGGVFDIRADSRLTLEGSRTKVGFDGLGGKTGVIHFGDDADLAFVADAKGMSGIGEFRSGAFGAAPDIQTVVKLDGHLKIDVTAWDTGAATRTLTLVKTDQMVGSFDSIEVIGLGARNATLIFDYDADEFRFELDANTGAGEVETEFVGLERSTDWSSDRDFADLWSALQQVALMPQDDLMSY